LTIAILRDNKLSRQTSFPIRLALIFLFALPLALSACYKQFIDGETTVASANSGIIHFGLSGPPGLYAGGGRALFVNATSAFYTGRIDVMTDDPPEDSSYGFNMHTINNTVTAMLDVPVHSNMSDLQRKLKPDQSLILSAAVNATFARLNSTPDSTERKDPEYWKDMTKFLGSKKLDVDTSPSSRRRPYGWGGFFEIWNAWVDSSLVFMSYYNETLNETFYDKAIGFNIYRGTANATWRISYNSIILLNASNFDTDYSPDTHYPERIGPNQCRWKTTNPNSQKVIYCGWVSLGQDYDHEVPDYLLSQVFGPNRTVSPVSVWVPILAAMGWSSTVLKYESQGVVDPNLQYLLQTPPYEASTTTTTLRRHWGLYVVLGIQPVLVLLVVIAQLLLESHYITTRFSLVALLAGVRHESLAVLKGASYSGELVEPVVVAFAVDKKDGHEDLGSNDEPAIAYTLRPKVSHARAGWRNAKSSATGSYARLDT